MNNDDNGNNNNFTSRSGVIIKRHASRPVVLLTSFLLTLVNYSVHAASYNSLNFQERHKLTRNSAYNEDAIFYRKLNRLPDSRPYEISTRARFPLRRSSAENQTISSGYVCILAIPCGTHQSFEKRGGGIREGEEEGEGREKAVAEKVEEQEKLGRGGGRGVDGRVELRCSLFSVFMV